MKGQKGFTLIELMIVVAVIGVLSAIAVPQYEKYVAKSQAASALSTISALKTNIESSIADNAVFPNVSATSAGSTTLGLPKTDLGSVALAPTNSASGAGGTITYNFTNTSSLIKTSNLLLTRDHIGNWKCSTSLTEKSLVPKSCR